MVTVENLIGRMSRAYHRNNLMYSLWKNPALLNNIDSKRFSSRCFQSHNLHPQVTGFVHASRYIFFSLRYFFFNSSNLEGIICSPKLCNKNIAHRARSRAKDHPTSLLLVLRLKNSTGRVLGMRTCLFA